MKFHTLRSDHILQIKGGGLTGTDLIGIEKDEEAKE